VETARGPFGAARYGTTATYVIEATICNNAK
jgi:hypothetical protein